MTGLFVTLISLQRYHSAVFDVNILFLGLLDFCDFCIIIDFSVFTSDLRRNDSPDVVSFSRIFATD